MSEAEIFECPVCHLHYQDEETAKQCEAYCSANQGCSLEIAKHAIEYSTKERESVDEG